jgi:hypothetical protein
VRWRIYRQRIWPRSPDAIFFPDLISVPFQHGLTVVFGVSIGLAVLAGCASLSRGRVGEGARLGD